jgi:predicted ATPase with chaperone activity
MVAKTFGSAAHGVDARTITVEVNVAPVDVKKEGSSYELPFALCVTD